jgi:hypothetical protein
MSHYAYSNTNTYVWQKMRLICIRIDLHILTTQASEQTGHPNRSVKCLPGHVHTRLLRNTWVALSLSLFRNLQDGGVVTIASARGAMGCGFKSRQGIECYLAYKPYNSRLSSYNLSSCPHFTIITDTCFIPIMGSSLHLLETTYVHTLVQKGFF